MSTRLALLLAASLILLLAWTFAVPIFEAPDEPQHWMNARYLHDRWRLPPYDSIYTEGGQAPLYYLLMAPLAVKTELPQLQLSCPPRIYADCAADTHRYWPIRAVRILTALLSVLTIIFVYLAGQEATGNVRTGLLAAGLAAFLPGFTFRGMNVSNDSLVALASAAATYGIVRLLRRDFTWPVAWFTAFAAAVAFLAKANGIAVGAVLCTVLLFLPAPWLTRGLRILAVMAAFVIAVPWLEYNQLIYGDPLGIHKMQSVLSTIVVPKSIGSAYFMGEFPVLVWRSFVGIFGWMNVQLPGTVYLIFKWAAVLACAGLVWRFIRIVAPRFQVKNTKEAAIIASLAMIVFLTSAQLVELNLTYTQPQGRLLFPALAAMMVLAAMGFEALPFWNSRVTAGAVLLFATINIVVLATVVVPAYWTTADPHKAVALDLGVPDNLMSGPAGPLMPGTMYGQTFTAQQNNLSVLEVLVATYNRRLSRGVLKMHLRANPADRQDLATVALPASSLKDCTYARFAFTPIPNSAHHTYYAALETEQLARGEHLTVFLSSKDVYSGGSFWIDGAPRPGQDTSFRAFYSPRADCQVCKAALPEEKVFRTR